MRELGTRRSSYGRLADTGLRRRHWSIGVVAFGLLFAGCAEKPKPPITTPVAMTVVAGADANPDARGRASPVTVRVYALKTTSVFESADFFSLFEKDQATLGAEMVQREELLMRPGDSKKLDFVFTPDVKAIGVVVAYRDLDRARWREVRTLDVGKPHTLNVGVGARQVKVEAR
jgi:type VI secretion system protein VasD